MLFLNHNGKKYSFVLLLAILQNSYADDVKSQESRQELLIADETSPIENADNFQRAEEDQVSSRINDQNIEDVLPVQTSRALDESAQEEDSDQSNPLEDGFIVLPLKSRRLLTEGVTISPNDIKPSASRALNNQRPVGSRTEIILPSLKELDEMKEAARQKRAKERAERQRRKKERRNSEYESSRYEFRDVPPPNIRRFVEDSGSRNRRVPPIFSRRRVNTRKGVMKGRTFQVPKMPEPFEMSELPKRKRLREPKLDDTEENDVSLLSEYRDSRDQQNDRDDDLPSVIVDLTSEEINNGKYIPVWLPQ